MKNSNIYDYDQVENLSIVDNNNKNKPEKFKFEKIIKGHKHFIRDFIYIPKHNILISAGWDYYVNIWNKFPKISLHKSMKVHKYGVNSLSYDKKTNTFASGAGDGKIVLWNLNGSRKKIISAHEKRINKIIFLRNTNILLSASCDKTIKFWDTKTWKNIHIFKHKNSVNDLTININESIMASASSDNTVKIWNIRQKTSNLKFQIHKNNVSSVAFYPKNNNIISADNSGKIYFWKTSNSGVFKILDLKTRINKINFFNNNDIVVSAKDTLIYNKQGHFKQKLPTPDNYYISASCMINYKNKQYLLTGGSDSSISFFKKNI